MHYKTGSQDERSMTPADGHNSSLRGKRQIREHYIKTGKPGGTEVKEVGLQCGCRLGSRRAQVQRQICHPVARRQNPRRAICGAGRARALRWVPVLGAVWLAETERSIHTGFRDGTHPSKGSADLRAEWCFFSHVHLFY